MKKAWIQKSECTGCGVCSNACPKGVIKMIPDETGFLYPSIGEECIDCDLCEKVCVNTKKIHMDRNVVPKTFAAWSKDDDIRFCSTSGGLFSELVKPLIAKGAYIAGAAYGKDNLVEHILINDIEGLNSIRQSKYIQSNTKKIYCDIRSKLSEGSSVVFCGAPCQVAALYAFLGKDYDCLTTIDFICRGMNSPKAYSSWLKEIEKTEKSKVIRVWFKYKKGGWKSSPKRTRLDFEDGHNIVLEGGKNLFMHGYLTSNLYIRESCGQCNFKGVPRQADITLADFWGIESGLDDDRGTSMVLVNSKKGEALLNEIKEKIEIIERSFDEIFAGNVCFKESVNIPMEGKDFLCELDEGTFSSVLKKYMKPYNKSIYERLLIRLKNIYKKVITK